jgi:hypothetical protein
MNSPVSGLARMAPGNVLYLGRAIRVGPNTCEAVNYRFLLIFLEFLPRFQTMESGYWHGSMVPREGCLLYKNSPAF